MRYHRYVPRTECTGETALCELHMQRPDNRSVFNIKSEKLLCVVKRTVETNVRAKCSIYSAIESWLRIYSKRKNYTSRATKGQVNIVIKRNKKWKESLREVPPDFFNGWPF